MSYLAHLQKPRWIRRWNGKTIYEIRLGNSGHNIIPDLSRTEEASIRDWFLEYGIEQDATHDLWWTQKKFGFHVLMSFGPDTMYHGGREFTISKEAYNKLFNGPG